ncbi:transcription initiation factor IIB [Halorubrum distributum JCM 9100]|uniref:Transcription initiation factor IIB n=2 Tax=Halorubrum distributum TaxID=29283 RepID=M0EMJ3_9EURY|nr:transcription initiation factor IIB family protein [Halorubrum distributum]ELZ48323.1 transcription initiation factor IIB [Halorubrum distributum JCM 9100]ELZ55693.1 transcription initiation factor IIB [Halorubrum distributum JCM 10118]
MSEEFIEEIDDILSDVLSDVDATSSAEIEQNITFGQSVSAERQTAIVDDGIDQLAAELDVPAATVDLAKSLRDQYRDQRGDLIGTALELVAASCLYCAVKVTEVPLDPTDFVTADDTVVTRKALLRRSKDIASTVGLDPSAFFGSGQYVDRYCDALDVSDAVNERAREIIEITEESGLSSGKSPSGWAAAAVYNACLDVGEKRTQQELSGIANVSEVTIRNRYQEQRAGLRQAEPLPADPIKVIDHVAGASEVGSATRDLAELLIENARADEYPVDKEATLWGLAALRRASQLTDGDIKIKTLSQYTDESSDEISSRARRLRSVLDHRELNDSRFKHTQQASEFEQD